MPKKHPSRLARGLIFAFFTATLSGCAKAGMGEEEISAYVKAKDSYILGEYDKAIGIIDSGRFSYGSGHQAYLLMAKCEFFNRKPASAATILRKLLKVNPRYAEAELWLARSLLAQGLVDEAETETEHAMEWNPEDPRLLSLMGSIQETKKDYQKAFEYYTRSTGFAEETGKDEIALAELYWRFGQIDKALERVQLAKSLISPDSAMYSPLDKLEERMKKEQRP